MHFSFPATSTIASISTYYITVTSTKVAARMNLANDKSASSIRASNENAECVFPSAGFHVQKIADPDTGILTTCTVGKMCIQDSSSSMGGRCVAASRPTRCTFANGTAGVKCSGDNACPIDTTNHNTNKRIFDIDQIGCGSCIGNYACMHWYETFSVGEGSCIGMGSCVGLEAPGIVSIGDGSCIGDIACSGIRSSRLSISGIIIGSGSCNSNEACTRIGDSIGDYSCNGFQACYSSDESIGRNSCNKDFACYAS